MRELFLATAVLAAFLVLFRKRRFDFFTVGLLSTFVYSLPSFLGEAVDVNFSLPTSLATRPIVDPVYGMKALLLALLAVGALLHDATSPARAEETLDEPALSTAAWWATGCGMLGLMGTLVHGGSTLFDPSKADVMAVLDRWFLLWETGAIVGFVLAWRNRSSIPLAVSGLLIAFHVYVGFRSAAAMAVIGVFTLWLSRRGPIHLLAPRNLRWIAAGALVVVGFFVYKGIYAVIKAGAWDLVEERLTDEEYFREVIFYSSEPFMVEGTLNEVVRSGFRVPAGHYRSLVHGLIPFSPELGAEPTTFNDRFQTALFPEREAGLASSFLAEAWAVGRWTAVLGVCVLYVGGVWIGSRLLLSKRPAVKMLAIVFFSSWAFFIHRNDLLYQAIQQRRILLLFLASLFLSHLVHRALHLPRAAGVAPASTCSLEGEPR